VRALRQRGISAVRACDLISYNRRRLSIQQALALVLALGQEERAAEARVRSAQSIWAAVVDHLAPVRPTMVT
jgi:hypothetical protein